MFSCVCDSRSMVKQEMLQIYSFLHPYQGDFVKLLQIYINLPISVAIGAETSEIPAHLLDSLIRNLSAL